jgi:hypothetical protein
MRSNQFIYYGTADAIVEEKQKFAAGETAKAKPTLLALVACLFVPCLIYATMFWLRSFELRYQAGSFADIMGYCLVTLPAVFAWLSCNHVGGNSTPLAFLSCTSLLALIWGYLGGDANFETYMRPFYEMSELSTYPAVDPSKYVGLQLVDAGQIEFTKGSQLWLQKSMGFKDKDVYCVAPIVSGLNVTQSTYDFWAVGINCCSGHNPDFHCGEYSNPLARKGLRLMDRKTMDIFRLVVKKAEVEFNLKAKHPLFMYWLSDTESELNSWQDDGSKSFIHSVVGYSILQFFLVIVAIVLMANRVSIWGCLLSFLLLK